MSNQSERQAMKVIFQGGMNKSVHLFKDGRKIGYMAERNYESDTLERVVVWKENEWAWNSAIQERIEGSLEWEDQKILGDPHFISFSLPDYDGKDDCQDHRIPLMAYYFTEDFPRDFTKLDLETKFVHIQPEEYEEDFYSYYDNPLDALFHYDKSRGDEVWVFTYMKSHGAPIFRAKMK